MEGTIQYLNLNQVQLFGFESKKSDKIIDSMVRGIEAGDEFPAVPVKQFDDISFTLSRFPAEEHAYITDGGHNRAIAHYIANKPLKVIILDTTNHLWEPWMAREDIRIAKLIDDLEHGKGKSTYKIKKDRDPKFR